MKDHPDDAISDRTFAFYQNALYYGDHQNFDLQMTLVYLFEQLNTDYLQSYSRSENVTDNPRFQITPDASEALICHVIRYDRLLRDNCAQRDISPTDCTNSFYMYPDHDRLVEEALAAGMCTELLDVPLEDIKLGCIEAEFEDLLAPLSWDN